MHAEMGEIIARGEAGSREFFTCGFDRGFFNDELGAVDPLVGLDDLAANRSEQVQMAFERRLDSGDGVEHVLFENSGELSRAAVLDIADVNVISQQQKKGP